MPGEQKEKIAREVTIPETITIQELANRMAERAVDVIRLLMKQGQMLKITDVIDADTAQLIAEEMATRSSASPNPTSRKACSTRPTSLRIWFRGRRSSPSWAMSITARPRCSTPSAPPMSSRRGRRHHPAHRRLSGRSPIGGKITFIDTPGHAAFTAMRARGAKVTDIVILVVAADDGVMPQTVEAINHAKAAKVPIIVAINKIDKPDAKPERVRTELLQYEIQVESLGGEVLDVEVSATKKTNLDKLLEVVLLQSEVLDLKANPNRSGEGAVIEARTRPRPRPVATVLVQRGTLKVGDIVVAGAEWGRVRTLLDDKGRRLPPPALDAGRGARLQRDAWDAGDRVAVVENARAREVTDYRARQKREKSVARAARAARSPT